MLTSLRPFLILTLLATLLLMIASPAGAEVKDVQHPFILWTADEAAAIKQRIDTDPEAKKQWDKTMEVLGDNPVVRNLLQYSVMGDQKAMEREKAELLKFIGTVPDPMTWEVDPKTLKWNEGMPSSGDRHMRDEQTLNALRYDVLYDQLTPEQRAGVEKSFRAYIQFHLEGGLPRHPAFAYDRTSWLPNMHWPRPIGTHVLAAALRDTQAIEAMFNAEGGFKWYMDDYLGDGRFYFEEFGKYYSNVSTMIMWCRALENLGLDDMGWGYTGKGGATMKRYLLSTIELGYPQSEWGDGSMPTIARMTMGDAKGTPLPNMPVQHTVVTGYLANGKGGNQWFSDSHMNGPMPKGREPFWFEAGHAQYPDAGFDYILSKMRAPGEEKYIPTLLFNLKPIDPANVQPPVAQSIIAPERGFAFLKMEESRDYWESPKPAVALQFAVYYVHYVHDAFSILGYQAFNRPIYMNGGGAGKGYAGGNAWKDSVRGHSGVVVDNDQAQPVARQGGPEGHTIRTNVADGDDALPVRFVAVAAEGVYANIKQERALFLTDDYLLDIFRLEDTEGKERTFDWQVQSPMSLDKESLDAWKPSKELDNGKLYEGGKFGEQLAGKPDQDLRDVMKLTSDAKGEVLVRLMYQQPQGESVLPASWWERGVGVDITMTPDPDAPTTVYAGHWPGGEMGDFRPTTVLARRRAKATTFVAVHAPYEGGGAETRLVAVAEVGRSDEALAFEVAGRRLGDAGGRDGADLIFFSFAPSAGEPVTLKLDKQGIACTFVDYAFISTTTDGMDIIGNVQSLVLPSKSSGKLAVRFNGEKVSPKVEGDTVTYTLP